MDDEIVRSSILKRMQEKYRAKRLQQNNNDNIDDVSVHIYEDDFSSELGLDFKKIGTILQGFRQGEYKGKIKDIFVDQLRSDIDVFLRGKMEPEDIIRKGKSYYDVTLSNFLPSEELRGATPEIYQNNNWWTVSVPGMKPVELYRIETVEGKKMSRGALFGILKEKTLEQARLSESLRRDLEDEIGDTVSGMQFDDAVDDINKKLKAKKLPMSILIDEEASMLRLVFEKDL